MRHRTDTHQRQIIDALQRVGRDVVNLSSVGNGCPDLLVPTAFVAPGGYELWELWELKTKDGVLTPDQVTFHATHKVRIIRSLGEALQALGIPA